MRLFSVWTLLRRLRRSRNRFIHPILLFSFLATSSLLSQGYLLQRQQFKTVEDLETMAIIPSTSMQKQRLLPTPIILVGMPKTGTSTIHSFFQNSGYRSSHYKCVNNLFCGLCIKVAIEQGKPPLQACGNYEVWAQMDVVRLGQCHFPQIHNLEIIHQEAPNATFLLSYRNMTHWARSVKNWVGNMRSMAARLTKCDGGPQTKNSEDLIQWHQQHIVRIRDFVKTHPTHTLVEIDIEDPQAGQIMSRQFGAASPATNWGHENNSLQRNASKMTLT